MGAAHEHRGNALIARQADVLINAAIERDNIARALQTAADCDTFCREAWSFIVEPTALRRGTVERSKRLRGYPSRHAALVAAHGAWVDTDHRTMAGVVASITRAKAAYDLLTFCLGSWTVPANIRVPRAATTQKLTPAMRLVMQSASRIEEITRPGRTYPKCQCDGPSPDGGCAALSTR